MRSKPTIFVILSLVVFGGYLATTIPVAVFKSLYKHHLTDAGLEGFAKDWKSTGQSIL